MFKVLFVLLLSMVSLGANGLLIEDSLGKGGVSLARGGKTTSIFSNPATIPFLKKNTLQITPMNGDLALSDTSAKFLKGLNAVSNSSNNKKNKKISDLLNENIGKPLHLVANNFSAIHRSEKNYSWLIGLLSSVDASFITHTGFGSLGAMESKVDEYHALVNTIGIKDENIKYGLTLKAVNKYQILHNYSILEMLEASSLRYYFDNKYQEKKFGIALDAGIVYAIEENPYDLQVAYSILNIGNTSFDTLGSIDETSNIGISFNPYKTIVVGIDYRDLFHQSNDLYAADNLRIGISNKFINNKLELSSGIYNRHLTFGIEYQFPSINIGLNTYETKAYNNQQTREYQFSLAYNW